MNTFEAISNRRAIRKFKSDPVPAEMITRCLEAARQAPSAANVQPWKFLVVRSAENRRAVMDAAFGQPLFETVPVVIVLLGDTQAYRKRFRTGQELIEVGAVDPESAKRAQSAYKEMKRPADDTSDIIMNCMLAGDHLVLEAAELGLGTCWVMLFRHHQLAAELNLPKHLFPVALIPLGYPDQYPRPRPRYPLAEIAFDENVEKPWG